MNHSADDAATEQDPRPIVTLQRSGLPGVVIVALAAVLALGLFIVLNNRRRHPAAVRSQDADVLNAFPSPPPLVIPPEAIALVTPNQTRVVGPIIQAPPVSKVRETPSYAITVSPPQLVSVPDPLSASAPSAPSISTKLSSTLNEPALVLDNGQEVTAMAGRPTLGANGATTASGAAAPQADEAPTRATIIANQTMTMPIGTIIPAVLETPIDTARPGLVRAIVSENARGFDGKRVLVPRGSRLIGEYQSEIRSGQNRVLVTWSRLLRSDGVAIRISSPAADSLGGAGIPGRVNSFFFQRFASAVLQSALTVGVNLASRPGSGSVIVGFPTSSAGSIGQNLLPSSDLRPKITVRQGALLNVVVAKDLDFSGTPLPLNGTVR